MTVHFMVEKTLNFLIQNSQVDLQPLDAKTARFSLTDLPLTLNFICTNGRIFVVDNHQTPADVDIEFKSRVFFALLKGAELGELLRQAKIKIHGDIKPAQLLVDLLKSADLDLEELLSQYTGDIVAHEVGKMAKKFKQNAGESDHPFTALKAHFEDFLINPAVSKSYKNKTH
jgi:ubiquinone biosynthesis protein UbiJ